MKIPMLIKCVLTKRSTAKSQAYNQLNICIPGKIWKEWEELGLKVGTINKLKATYTHNFKSVYQTVCK